MSSNLHGSAEQSSDEGPSNTGRAAGSASPKLGVKRKLTVKTMSEKYQAILAVEKGEKTKAQIALDFNVPRNTLSTWLKSSEKIKKMFLDSDLSPSRKRQRLTQNPETETAVLRWFKNARDQNIPVSGPMIQAKADDYASRLGSDFKASNGWLDRFKERHNISFRRICGESNSVDTNSDDMKAWETQRHSIMTNYASRDIYNADETGLFFRLMPDKSLDFKGSDCKGEKRSKERLTVMVCANMDGTDKLPLLVIGKSAKPRCFKNVNTLPTEYTSNKKAWMTSEIFTTWLEKLDKKIQRQNRRIAMIVDNCPAHPHLKTLKAIDLYFLPPNTTSKTQPMDQGIIQKFKVHYRKGVIMRHVHAVDSNKTVTLTVLDALRLMATAWNRVTDITIANCFRHCGFTSDPSTATTGDGDDDDDDVPLAALARMQYPFRDYVRVDDNIPTSEHVTDDAIIDDIITARTEQAHSDAEDDDDSDDETSTQPPPSMTQAIDAFHTLRQYLETKTGMSIQLSTLSNIGDDILQEHIDSRVRQSTIRDFFC